MGHFNSQGCGDDCCCTGRLYEDGCFLRWESNNADAGQLIFDGIPIQGGESGYLNNPPTGQYKLQVQCTPGGDWTDSGVIDWVYREVCCCQEGDPLSNCYDQLTCDSPIEGWLITLEISDPTNEYLTAGAISAINGTYTLNPFTDWEEGNWRSDIYELPSGSVDWLATCGFNWSGTPPTPHFAIMLAAVNLSSAGFRCRMGLTVSFGLRNQIFTGGLYSNLIDCVDVQTGAGVAQPACVGSFRPNVPTITYTLEAIR